MTTTAEEKAKAVIAEFHAATDPSTASPDREWDMVKLIAAAITQAQNDKLEEAAQCADAAQAEADACSSRVVEEEIVAAAVSGCCGVIAASIRSLKTPKD